ncbi:MAG TPA: alpha/beta fold hydrolase [Steroidobacteraceae bacterium]
MKVIGGIPVFEVEFDKKGKLFDAKQLKALVEHLHAKQTTDLILFSHGWNNDLADARKLYTQFFAEFGAFAPNTANGQTRVFAAAAILWPSKKFTDKELIPGGGAAALTSQELAAIRARLRDLAKEPVRLGKFEPASATRRKKVAKAEKLLANIENDPKAQEEFVRTVRSLLATDAADKEDGTNALFKMNERKLLDSLKQPVLEPLSVSAGGTAGSFATLSTSSGGAADLGSSIHSALRRFLNLTTYYQMKARAGTVGAQGVAGVIAKLRAERPKLRLHLVGHSFGGRVVTAAADAAGGKHRIDSLTLLQAAFSHNGFAQKFDGKRDGFFRKVVDAKKVRGPILVTCTKNDKAVGIAYPLASRLAGQDAAAIGDENDVYGGIGRNGAVKTPEAIKGTLLAANAAYDFVAGKIHNLVADAFIADHSDICNPQVAWALASAISRT